MGAFLGLITGDGLSELAKPLPPLGFYQEISVSEYLQKQKKTHKEITLEGLVEALVSATCGTDKEHAVKNLASSITGHLKHMATLENQMREENHQKNQSLHSMEDQLTAVADQLANTLREKASLAMLLDEALQANADLDKQLSQRQEKNKEAEAQLADLNKKLSGAEEENSNLNKKLSGAEKENSNLKSELAGLRQNHDTLETQLKEKAASTIQLGDAVLQKNILKSKLKATEQSLRRTKKQLKRARQKTAAANEKLGQSRRMMNVLVTELREQREETAARFNQQSTFFLNLISRQENRFHQLLGSLSLPSPQGFSSQPTLSLPALPWQPNHTDAASSAVSLVSSSTRSSSDAATIDEADPETVLFNCWASSASTDETNIENNAHSSETLQNKPVTSANITSKKSEELSEESYILVLEEAEHAMSVPSMTSQSALLVSLGSTATAQGNNAAFAADTAPKTASSVGDSHVNGANAEASSHSPSSQSSVSVFKPHQ